MRNLRADGALGIIRIMPASIPAFLLLLSVSVSHSPQQPVTPAPLQVIKVRSGPSGVEKDGTFVLSEERSTFSRVNDREVIVHFQWEGAPGPHSMTARWTSVDGGVSSSSTVSYTAKDRQFGAYWRLPISPSMPLGTWTIEATVDGQPAGRHEFTITDTTAPIAAAPVKRPLTAAEIYERLNRIFVTLQRSTANGRRLDMSAGMGGANGRIYTAMASVDDVDHIRAVWADGNGQEITSLAAFNRRQDWAVLLGGPTVTEALPIAAASATRVGDRCFALEAGTTGARVLAEGTISGGTNGQNVVATFHVGTPTPGGPVVNEYGEIIGLVGIGDISGATRMQHVMRFRMVLKGTPLIPFHLIRVVPDAAPQALADLRARGEVLPALVGDEHVLSGGFARQIDRNGPVQPVDQREDFSVREKKFSVFLTWNPQQRLRGKTVLRIYDRDNTLVAESKEAKVSFPNRRLSFSSWEIPMLSQPGTYRVDIFFEGKPAWRGFVTITP